MRAFFTICFSCSTRAAFSAAASSALRLEEPRLESADNVTYFAGAGSGMGIENERPIPDVPVYVSVLAKSFFCSSRFLVDFSPFSVVSRINSGVPRPRLLYVSPRLLAMSAACAIERVQYCCPTRFSADNG